MTADNELRNRYLIMTFDNQSNARRTAVESKSNLAVSCSYRITTSAFTLCMF